MISDALTLAKEALNLANKYKHQDLYQAIVELRDKVFALTEENLQLKEDLRELRQVQDVSAQLKRVGNQYERTLQDGSKTGPFCLVCWDGDRRLVNLIEFGDGYTTTVYYRCDRCKSGC